MKICTTCKAEKEESLFNKDKQKKDGLNPRCKECSRKWHHKNKDRVKEYQKEYYKNNAELFCTKAKKYRRKNHELLNKKKKEWDANNFDYRKEYRTLNSDKYSAYARNRRARINNCSGSHTSDDIKTILASQKNKCAVCYCDVSNGYHVDHIVPIAKGGDNDKYNLQVTCPSCNFSKNDSDPIEYAQRYTGRLL
jgi:5-methylcytosine-specific restriction endonuclease McrA